MRKSLLKTEEENLRETSEADKYCLGNLDLLNLRLNLSPNATRISTGESTPRPLTRCVASGAYSQTGLVPRKNHHHPLENSQARLTANISNLPQGYGKSHHPPNNISSENLVLLYSKEKKPELVFTEPINRKDFLFPSKKKLPKGEEQLADDRMLKFNSNVIRDGSGTFPFKFTPSGNIKVNSQQVVYVSKKLSVLAADPRNTKVNVESGGIVQKMTHEPTEFSKTSAMDTIMSQAGFSSLGSLIANTPVRSGNKEASEYESKQTSEILDPELNLGRLGYCGTDTITWDKVVLPEKKNLYLELYSRITNYTNADCKIYIDSEEFNCHLIVLQCYSELFDAYIAVKKVEIPAEKCSPGSFAFIYEWMITGEPSYRELNRENVLDIFNSSKYLKIKDLVEQCWAFIDNTDVFSEDTAFILYMDAKKKSVPEVRELMLPRIQAFFLMLVSSQDWLELEVEDVMNLLKSNYICVNCEMEIFMSAVRWLKHDWTNRDQSKYEVLECVRFGNIAPWQLVDIKRNPENPDFMELAKDQRICKMIDDGLAYVIIKYWYGQENDDFQHWNTVLGLQEPPPRNWSGSDKTYFTYREFLIYLDQYRRNQLIEKNKPKMLSEKKFVPEFSKQASGGNQQEKLQPKVPTMDEFLSKKKNRTPPSKDKNKAARIIQNAYRIYKEASAQTSLLDHPNVAQEKVKKPQSDIVMRRKYHHPIAPSNQNMEKYLVGVSLIQKEMETILVFGGVNPQATCGVGRNTAQNIFRYVVDDNVWEYVGALPEPRHQHAAVFLKGRVYLVGGSNPVPSELFHNHPVDTVWSFDPISKIWYRENNLNTARKNLSLVVANQSIFALGGQGTKEQPLKSVEKFNPLEGVWKKRASMITPRTGAASAKYQNFIWVAGGLCGPEQNILLDSVETYNLKTDQWTKIKRLPFPRCFSSMCVMSNRLFIIGGLGKINKHDKTCSSIGDIDVWSDNNRRWETVINLSIPRHGHAVGYFGSQIFIIGGATTVYRKSLSGNECYCSERGVFVRGIACLPAALSGHAVATLPPAILMPS